MTLKRKILSANRLLHYQRSFSLWQAINAAADFRVVNNFTFSRALVLSPHPDDETLGCGGTIQIYSRSSQIDVAFMFCGDKACHTDTALSRRREAQDAGSNLGVAEQFFLDTPDGGQVELSAIKKIILQGKYDAIFCPNPVDPHPDHAETAFVLSEVIKQSKISPEIIFYEVWNPLTYFNRLVIIDSQKKSDIIKLYTSQLKERNYLAAMSGLNTYRAEIMGQGEAGEAFMSVPAEVMVKIMRG